MRAWTDVARAAARPRRRRRSQRCRGAQHADACRRHAVRAVAVLHAVAGAARRRGGSRDPHHGRHADLRGPRQRRRVGAPRSVRPARRRRAARRGRRAARLLQRDRPAVGQSALSVGSHEGRRLRVVDRALAHDARARRPRAPRSLPRLRRLLGGARRCDDRACTATGSAGRPATSSTRLSAALGPLPIVAENLGFITADVEALRDALRAARHGDPAVRLRHRSAGARLPAAQLHARPRGLHRHARQRHDDRLGARRRRRQHAIRPRMSRASGAMPRPTSERRATRCPGRPFAACSRRWPTRRSSPCRTCSASAARRA